MKKIFFLVFLSFQLFLCSCYNIGDSNIFVNNQNFSSSNENQDVKNNNLNTEKYCFFTDPHFIKLTGESSIDENILSNYFNDMKDKFENEKAEFIMCGGDIINDSDSKEIAIKKLENFHMVYNNMFYNSHYIIGNHDTNYQGDTYVKNGDYKACQLSCDEIRNTLFDGDSEYYYFDTNLTRYYCFNSGLDWDSNSMDNYRWNQIDWFANDLLTNKMNHSVIFIHIPYFKDSVLTAMIDNLNKIIIAYNNRERLFLKNYEYDYSNVDGYIEFIHSGHMHKDVVDYDSCPIPLIVTDLYMIAKQSYTYDMVTIDYDNCIVSIKRYGDGNDRIVLLNHN